MCGRFTVTATPNELLNRFGVTINSNLAPRCNVAPSQLSPIIKAHGMTNEIEMAHFGLEGVVAHKSLINARAETITEKPTFASAFRTSRCLIVASGWYEWKAKGEAYHIQLGDGRVMAFGGLSFTKAGQSRFVIVTAAATGALADIHHRTPLVLAAKHWQSWLQGSTQEAQSLLAPIESQHFNAYQVSPDVGNVRNDHAGLTAPYSPPKIIPDQADLFS